MFFIIVSNKLEFNLEYVLTYPEFKAVYDQCKTLDDVDKVFAYIYEVADIRSYANRRNYTDAETHEYALMKSKLDDNFKVTRAIKKAIDFYRAKDYSVEANLLKDLRDTLSLSIKTNKRIQKVLEKIIDDDTVADSDALAVIDYQKKLFNIIDELPNQIQKVKQLEVKVHEQLSKPDTIGRGGEVIPTSYEGDSRIEGEV